MTPSCSSGPQAAHSAGIRQRPAQCARHHRHGAHVRSNTANSQFFINVVDNAFLNRKRGRPGYAVFGKVISGMDVVDKIRVVPVAPQGVHQHFPVTPSSSPRL